MRCTPQDFFYSKGIPGLLRRNLQGLCTSFKGGKMARRVDHIGILVSNMDEAIKLYKDCFGAKVDKIETLAGAGSEGSHPFLRAGC